MPDVEMKSELEKIRSIFVPVNSSSLRYSLVGEVISCWRPRARVVKSNSLNSGEPLVLKSILKSPSTKISVLSFKLARSKLSLSRSQHFL